MAVERTLPGETPLDDISGLKVKGVSTRGQLHSLEAENIRKPTVKYLSRKPSRRSAKFDFSWTLKLHKEMFGDVWTWAGALRTCDLNLGIPWQKVETSLFELLKDLSHWKNTGIDILEQAALLHHRAVFIHPFLNGNGRWARMLANIWLKLHKRQPTSWPEVAVAAISTIRDDYLAAMRKADEGDYEPLNELHKRYTPS